MQYEGQRFSYTEKVLDDKAVTQGVELHGNLGVTNITKNSELLARGNEKVDSLDLGEYRNKLLSVHGGDNADKNSVDGPLIAFGKNIPKESLDFKYNEGIQIYTQRGVELISKYKHQKGEPVIVWGHSLGADSTLEAYGKGYVEVLKKNIGKGVYRLEQKKYIPQKANELNIVMPRVKFIEKYLNKASEKAGQINLFMLKEDRLPFPHYEDRSYETLMLKVKNGEIKIPKNVNIIGLNPVVEDDKNKVGDYISNNHGSALKNSDKMFEQIKKKYKEVKDDVK